MGHLALSEPMSGSIELLHKLWEELVVLATSTFVLVIVIVFVIVFVPVSRFGELRAIKVRERF